MKVLKPSGFTLVELLLTTIGMLGLAAVLFVVFRTTFNAMALVRARSSVTNTLQAAFEQIGRDIQGGQQTQCFGVMSTSGKLLVSNTQLGSGGVCAYYVCTPPCTVNTPGNLHRIGLSSSSCVLRLH